VRALPDIREGHGPPVHSRVRTDNPAGSERARERAAAGVGAAGLARSASEAVGRQSLDGSKLQLGASYEWRAEKMTEEWNASLSALSGRIELLQRGRVKREAAAMQDTRAAQLRASGIRERRRAESRREAVHRRVHRDGSIVL